MSENRLTEKIVSDAEERALAIVADAKRRADAIISEAEVSARALVDERMELAKARGEDTLRRYEINARLDSNKKLLAAKLAIVDGVFQRALEILAAMPKAEYAAFVGGLLEKFAEEGDRVILSQNCNCRAEIAALDIVRKRALIIENTPGDFVGGAVLIGKNSDKNITFEALVEGVREKKQAEVAERLFG